MTIWMWNCWHHVWAVIRWFYRRVFLCLRRTLCFQVVQPPGRCPYLACCDISISFGTRRHGQEGHLSPSGNVASVLCIAKRSMDELFMHYFHNLSSASRGFAPRLPPGLYPWAPAGDFCPQTSKLPIPGKNPAGAHGYLRILCGMISTKLGTNIHHAICNCLKGFKITGQRLRSQRDRMHFCRKEITFSFNFRPFVHCASGGATDGVTRLTCLL